ncbi:MAG: ATP-binding cassette domain-containing protein [Candidatus Altiarchaeales archaeon]|nr:ATP-binding cassette domain-containing protein [Candidatus Altiarchaeales archaeon]
MSEKYISVEELNVYYQGHELLKDVNVNIPEKRIVCIIGPSGSGKTMLLRCFNRFIDLNEELSFSGRILMDGVNILDKSVDVIKLRASVGMISQKPYPLPMSIYDNVAYGPRLHGEGDKSRLDHTVKESLNQAALWDEVKDRLNEPATKLSIGQQQRLCLARVLAVKPKILLCDEATSALDPVSSHKIEQQILKLSKEYTIIMSTHNIHQAKRLADYVIYVYLGSLIEHGPAKEIFKNPKHERTQAYLKGEYYEEYTVDREVDLREFGEPVNYMKTKEALDNMQVGQVLRLIVNTREALKDIPKGLETEGQKIIHRKTLNKKDWEIVVRKLE